MPLKVGVPDEPPDPVIARRQSLQQLRQIPGECLCLVDELGDHEPQERGEAQQAQEDYHADRPSAAEPSPLEPTHGRIEPDCEDRSGEDQDEHVRGPSEDERPPTTSVTTTATFAQ